MFPFACLRWLPYLVVWLGTTAPLLTCAQPTLTTLAPAANALHALRTSSIQALFSQPLSPVSVGGLRVFSTQRGGRRTGHSGTSTVSGNAVVFTPTYPWQPGEVVQTVVTTAVQNSAGVAVGAGRVAQFTATPTGGSGLFVLGSDVNTNTSTESITTADVDGDGDLDLLTAQYHGNRINIQFNTGNGTFVYSSDVLVGTIFNASPFSVTTADLDGDGDLDLLTANNWPNGTASVRFNDGTGHFGGGSEIVLGTNPVWITTADVDADGDLDLLAANAGSSDVSVRFNDGTGSFSTGSLAQVGPAAQCVVTGDVDGDGDLDLLTANYGVYGGAIGTTVSVRLNNGTGQFTGSQEVVVGPHPFALAVGDVDADGDLDLLAVSSDAAGAVNVRLNNGAGQFSGGSDVAVGPSPRTVTVGDVDGDGDLDFLTANYGGSGSASVRLNDGSGHFLSGSEVATASGAWSIATADVDGDGDLDLLAGTFPGIVSIRLNQNIAPAPTLQIRGDSLLCNGGQVQLTASSSGTITAYQWSTGATTSSIIVSQPGLYQVTTTFSNGQTNTAQFRVRALTPTVHIRGDSLLCSGSAVQLVAVAHGAKTLRWSTGDTTTTVTVTGPGLYSVTATYGTGCSATAQRLLTVPQIQIVGVPVVCAGSSTLLTAIAPGATAFHWNNGLTTASLVVTQPGTYQVVATFATGCTLTASQQVLGPSIQLLGDSLVCSGQIGQLTTTAAGATSYQWNTGATTPTITFTQPGTYAVTVTYGPGCTATTQRQIQAVAAAPSYSLGADTTVCEGAPLVLRVLGAGIAMAHYRWSDGSTAATLPVEQSGLYSLQLVLPCSTQTLTRHVAFEVCLTIPNIITPNGDGLNDYFRIKGLPAGSWALTLYNRWGAQVYQTAAYQQDWGRQAAPGLYYYQLQREATGTSYKGWLEVLP